MGRLDGKVCVITGAVGGIGSATCELFAREGATVAGADVTENAPGDLSMQVDVTHEGRVIEMYEHVLQTYGRIDVLFNNAGIDPLRARSVLETEVGDWDRIMDVNVRSAFVMSQAAIPLMREGGGGTIVNTASIAGLKPAADEAAYSVSKAAMVSLTGTLALDFAADGIRANCVCPGFMEMVMTDRRRDLTEEQQAARAESAAARVPLGRQGTYEEVAKAVLFLAGPDASYITGAALVVDGGLLLR
ncbi:MAG: SDR family oxidoreductase [Actinobacteria bacterium]|nr:MAG: SDR family oxidoreductase [Actinomycetota bacterium]